MTKIFFKSFEQDHHTHRITDGTESSYFAWPDGADWDDVLSAFADGYETDEAVSVECYSLEENELVHTGQVLA